MFDHVKEAVDKGEVLLEWDYSKVDEQTCTVQVTSTVGRVLCRLYLGILFSYEV